MAADLSKYTFCVGPYSGPRVAMCIRPMRLRGVFDTGSLCGRIVPRDHGGYGGHDVPEPLRADLLDDDKFVCRECSRRVVEGK